MAIKNGAVKETVVDLPEGVGAGVAPIQITGAERRQRISEIDRMRDKFAAEPKIRIRLAEDARVQINGYTFEIKGKVPVEVPESVATILEQSGRY